MPIVTNEACGNPACMDVAGEPCAEYIPCDCDWPTVANHAHCKTCLHEAVCHTPEGYVDPRTPLEVYRDDLWDLVFKKRREAMFKRNGLPGYRQSLEDAKTWGENEGAYRAYDEICRWISQRAMQQRKAPDE